ncbi:hypothetical protein CTRI78_v001056 [Colletotrichum trifolii]|uniref:Uncharacterized protein n=1 Tax=Colletotrichum trifolii TaxID=5466 RepID=A0A4V3HXD7_COLTR|nr:hypothetical protein CTRI78_v001056 [Colletotrichum trifolii]
MLVCLAVPRQSSTFRSGYGQAMDSRRKESFGGSMLSRTPAVQSLGRFSRELACGITSPSSCSQSQSSRSVFDWAALAKRLGAGRCLPSASSHIAASGLMRE